ncbi:HNH endonuclease signature motif containing protein [Marinovum sp. SP66]|uniref:HNH endonuclease signature motif containing protein n=1 Tax=Marinovum TaxID=367771 RepID=UPI00237A9C33|nr:HNH endonuclease signature motif containing protein [Marinovum sp. SP66]MDD9738462.1 HNH endonuclease signature motif containing protein [Marinovum sp. SP66]
MKGRAIRYSAEELGWIKANSTRPRAEAHADFVHRFDRQDVTLANFNSLCKRKGWMTGRTGRLEKGNVPPNKGRTGYCAPGSEKGWFRKGSMNGRARALYQPIGSERVSKDGYLERKIHDGQPLQSRWRAVHLIRWEEAHGPIPEGHCLKCLDGDRTNTAPENWRCIPRALLPRLSGGRWHTPYEAYEPELRSTVLTIAELEHRAREAKKERSA